VRKGKIGRGGGAAAAVAASHVGVEKPRTSGGNMGLGEMGSGCM
jgi:hypothetical protein